VSEQVEDTFSIHVKHPRNALDLALTGVGRIVLPTLVGDQFEDLKRIGDEIDQLKHRQWLVTHQDDRHKPEVRKVFEWIKATLGGDQVLD